jgi:predicted transcriptional regulator of viral defense system
MQKISNSVFYFDKNMSKDIFDAIDKIIDRPTTLKIADKIISDYLHGLGLSDSQYYGHKKNYIRNKLKRLPIKYQLETYRKIIVSRTQDVDPLEIIHAFNESAYISFLTALYHNELVDHNPNIIQLSIERSSRGVRTASLFTDLDRYKVRDTFVKQPRATGYAMTYKDHKYEVYSRENTNKLGVYEKGFSINSRQLKIPITDIERTLIDCTVAPHRIGGIDLLLSYYKAAGPKLNLERLRDYYFNLKLLYPYWQRIGFILERSLGSDIADKWNGFFYQIKSDFYVTHQYKSTWKLDEKWKIYYPANLKAL